MRIILVTVPDAAADYTLVSLLRNVGEEVYRRFHFDGIAEVPDMDSAVTELHIHVLSTRHLGDVSSALKKALRKHAIADRAQITRMG